MTSVPTLKKRFVLGNESANSSAQIQIPGGILFAIFQNRSRANGGLESISQIIEGIDKTPRLVLTNAETAFTARWRRASAEITVWPLPYAMGSPWQTGGIASVGRRLWTLIATNWWTWRTLRRHQVKAVHCNDPAPFWHVALGARLARVPLVLNLRDTKSPEDGLKIGKYRRKFRLCKRVLVLSREMKEFYERTYQCPAEKRFPTIDYIHSVVDSKRMHPLSAEERLGIRRRLGIEDETFAVGFIATFNEKKNQLGYLQKAVPLLRQICPTAQTFFVGDFEPHTDVYSLNCKTAASAVEKFVRFVGFCSEVQKWYQACDVIVVPTRKEGLARCMIEALACGTPVVSFDVSSAKEILEEHQCGKVVSQGDYEQLCRGIVELAQFPHLRRDYGARGVALARRLFSAEESLSQYRNLVLNLDQSDLGISRAELSFQQ